MEDTTSTTPTFSSSNFTAFSVAFLFPAMTHFWTRLATKDTSGAMEMAAALLHFCEDGPEKEKALAFWQEKKRTPSVETVYNLSLHIGRCLRADGVLDSRSEATSWLANEENWRGAFKMIK